MLVLPAAARPARRSACARSSPLGRSILEAPLAAAELPPHLCPSHPTQPGPRWCCARCCAPRALLCFYKRSPTPPRMATQRGWAGRTKASTPNRRTSQPPRRGCRAHALTAVTNPFPPAAARTSVPADPPCTAGSSSSTRSRAGGRSTSTLAWPSPRCSTRPPRATRRRGRSPLRCSRRTGKRPRRRWASPR